MSYAVRTIWRYPASDLSWDISKKTNSNWPIHNAVFVYGNKEKSCGSNRERNQIHVPRSHLRSSKRKSMKWSCSKVGFQITVCVSHTYMPRDLSVGIALYESLVWCTTFDDGKFRSFCSKNFFGKALNNASMHTNIYLTSPIQICMERPSGFAELCYVCCSYWLKCRLKIMSQE